MRKTLVLAFSLLLSALSSNAGADIIIDFDSTDPGFSFTFDDGSGLTFSEDLNGVGNVGEGWVTEITALPSQPAFSGMGIGDLDLAASLGVASNNSFSVADFEDLVLSFEYNTSVGAGMNSARLDAAGFGSALLLNATLESEGVWETATFNFSELPTASIQTFVDALNGENDGLATFQLSFAGGPSGALSLGDTFSIDNLSLTTAVPEPSSALMLVGLGVIGSLRRRR